MGSLIGFGALNSQDGRTTGFGFATGIDSSTLIDAILSPQVSRVEADQVSIDKNVSKNTALDELSQLLGTLRTKADGLRSPTGVGVEDIDLFKHTLSTVSSSTTIAASNYLDVTSVSGATTTSYAIDDVVVAKEHIIRKDNFTSDTASVVGNASVTDNYQVSLGTVTGTVLNTATPITFANDIQNSTSLQNFTTATAATLDVIFSSENKFDATDSITVGATTITFGGTGGNDIDISAATTLDQKIDAIVTRLNAIASGDETAYTYSRPSTGILRLTRDVAGPIATVGTDINVTANFSTGDTDTTQKVGIGKVYKNNGSAAGSVALSNGAVTGSVSNNGVDGLAASTKATISVDFANNNFDTTLDQLVVGGTTITFGGGGGDDITVGADLPATIVTIANLLNSKTTGEESGYTFTSDGVDSLIITRDVYGDHATVDTNLAISADLSLNGTDTTNTVKIGDLAATNGATAGTVNGNGTDGVNVTSITDAKTTHTTTLSGAVTFPSAPVFNAGSSDGLTFTPNSVTFKATIGGETYTSRAVELDGGNITGTGAGDGGLGNRIPSGTVITFVKDSQTDSTEGTKDVTFQLVVGAEATVTAATVSAYQTSFGTFLNTTNTITVTQNPTVPTFRAGTFTLGGVDISIASGDNLQVIKSKINAVSLASGVSADVIKVNDANFSLVLKSTTTGETNKIVEFGEPTEPGDSPANTLQFGLDNVSFTQQQAANDLSFRIDGLTVTRATNTVSDAIDKVTFNFKASTGVDDPTLTVKVDNDTGIVKNAIIEFANAYNEVMLFIAKQTQRDDNGIFLETAILEDDQIIRDTNTILRSKIAQAVTGLPTGALTTIADLGLRTIPFDGDAENVGTDGVLTLDEATLDAALLAKFDEVRKVSGVSFEANSVDISLFTTSNRATLTNFKIDIDTSRSDSDKVRILDATTDALLFNADISGSVISGKQGTSLEGVEFIYTGDGTDVITATLTNGLFNNFFIDLENSFLKKDTGRIDTAKKTNLDKNETLQNRIDIANVLIASRRQQLELIYTQLEETISEANRISSQIRAQNNANLARIR